jgi:DNA repair exonuclease SbcCD ATPase subunit
MIYMPSVCVIVVLPSSEPTASKTPKPAVVPIQTVLPGRHRKSTIRLPNRDGPVLQRLQEFEAKTGNRLDELEKNNMLIKKLMSTVSALNEEHKSFHSHKTEATQQIHALKEHFHAVMNNLVSVVEKCVKKVDVAEEDNHVGNELLRTQVEDIRTDLQCVIQETMRAAKPQEKGIVFKSLVMPAFDQSSDVAPVSMLSKEVPGAEDVQQLIEGLKQLDAAFKQKVEIMAKLTMGQENIVQNVTEVEDSLQQLKYLVLHSIQLPAKPAAVPK